MGRRDEETLLDSPGTRSSNGTLRKTSAREKEKRELLFHFQVVVTNAFFLLATIETENVAIATIKTEKMSRSRQVLGAVLHDSRHCVFFLSPMNNLRTQ